MSQSSGEGSALDGWNVQDGMEPKKRNTVLYLMTMVYGCIATRQKSIANLTALL